MAEISLITHYDKKSPVAEAYRAVRTNLQFAGAGKPLKLISITSATPGEGKSTTISNLSVAMGQDGKKVLLIDGDMRKPIQHKLFNLPNRGLSNCIASDLKVSDLICHAVMPNVDVLPSGPVPPNPSELLGSPKMEEILHQVSEEYDYVLIDCPPVLPVTDAAVMASHVDGTIMVVDSGEISPEEAQAAKAQLLQGKAKLLGVILNGVSTSHHYGGYNYYYYYYYDEEHVKHKGHKNRKENSKEEN